MKEDPLTSSIGILHPGEMGIALAALPLSMAASSACPRRNRERHGYTFPGRRLDRLAACFGKGPLETAVLGPDIGQASGLKMCFAANSKGTAAMQTAILGAAEVMGVREALERQWDLYNPGFTAKSHSRIRQVARKAWRFTGEMEEIAKTLETCGMPPEFHRGAAEIYSRQALFKDADEEPAIEEILAVVSAKQRSD